LGLLQDGSSMDLDQQKLPLADSDSFKENLEWVWFC
jgi:hypothetical protein